MKRIEASAARRHGLVPNVDPGNESPRVPGIPDVYRMGIGSESGQVAPGVHQAALDAMILQHLDGAVHREALRKAA